MSELQPNEYAVLLKIVEVIQYSLMHRSDSDGSDEKIITQLILSSGNLQAGIVVNRETTMGDQYTVGQAGAVGPEAHAEKMSFNQIWSQASGALDLKVLAAELQTLRAAMRREAEEPDQDQATAEVGHAQIAASQGDGPRALSHLSRAGKWALGVATTIGTTAAVEALKHALGL